MSWNQVGEYEITSIDTLLPTSFTSRLAIKASDVTLLKPTWNWAGYFIQYLEIPDFGLAQIDKKNNLSIRDTSLFIPTVFEPSYQLKFVKADWIPSLTLTIYEDSMPIYNASDTVVFPNNKYANSTATAVPPATTSTALLAANANRKGVVVANNTNQLMVIERGATATLAAASITLAPKTAGGLVSVWEDDDYTGAISAIAAAAATGAWNVREFT
jgi:hypothetical protein